MLWQLRARHLVQLVLARGPEREVAVARVAGRGRPSVRSSAVWPGPKGLAGLAFIGSLRCSAALPWQAWHMLPLGDRSSRRAARGRSPSTAPRGSSRRPERRALWLLGAAGNARNAAKSARIPDAAMDGLDSHVNPFCASVRSAGAGKGPCSRRVRGQRPPVLVRGKKAARNRSRCRLRCVLVDADRVARDRPQCRKFLRAAV